VSAASKVLTPSAIPCRVRLPPRAAAASGGDDGGVVSAVTAIATARLYHLFNGSTSTTVYPSRRVSVEHHHHHHDHHDHHFY
jgi:hypothetical protein